MAGSKEKHESRDQGNMLQLQRVHIEDLNSSGLAKLMPSDGGQLSAGLPEEPQRYYALSVFIQNISPFLIGKDHTHNSP